MPDRTPAANIAAEEPAELPTAPAFILREGAVKGRRFVVLAISPIFAENGVVKVAGSFRAQWWPVQRPLDWPSLAVAAASQPQGVTEAVAVPVNQAA